MNLHEVQMDTPLQVVNDIFVQGNFPTCPVTDEIKEGGEIEIGELTDYEKAIMLARNQSSTNGNAIIDQAREAEDITEEQKKAINRYKEQSSLFNDLLWMSIRHRLNGQTQDEIGIRANWKIVNILPQEEDEPGEKCQNCPKRDGCPILALHILME